MRRLGMVWLIFGCCVALAAAAIARVGATALSLEQAEAKARRQAGLEENLQLALWRMDSTLAPLIAEESARPYFSYSSLYPAERAFTCMFAEIQKGDVLVPSPLLTFSSPLIRLHFQYGPDGRLSSPQVPSGNMRDLAETRYLRPEQIETSSQRLDQLSGRIKRDDLAAFFAVEEIANTVQAYEPQAQSRGANEYMMRSKSNKIAQNAVPAEALPIAARATVKQGPIQAFWIGEALVLARRVRVEEGTFLQGCWLDWDVIRRDLMAAASDLLPQAVLEPVRSPGETAPTRMLASLPARLVPGALTDDQVHAWSPVRISLMIAFASLILATAAISFLLRGALSLSERRGTFVSAVTHELRTPLTTFRLYTEMLDEGMVTNPDTRKAYVKTLRAEADRLGRLVENVLTFARLERGRAADRSEVVTASELLDRLLPSLALRARQAGMEIAVRSMASQSQVRVDITIVDQILSNLVDNAIKYAGEASDRQIHFDTVTIGRWLALKVRDHGPGLSPQVVRQLFRPFSKSAHDAAHSAPGVGLGLALSRRLARSLGGDLRLDANGKDGATFLLTLPIA